MNGYVQESDFTDLSIKTGLHFTKYVICTELVIIKEEYTFAVAIDKTMLKSCFVF